MIKRLIFYILAIFILGFGIVLNTKAGLGVGSINTLPYALSRITPLSLGMATTLMYFVFVAGQTAIYRKIDAKVLLQIPFSYVMGVVIDFYDNLMDFRAETLPLSFLLLAAAIVCTAFGAYVTVTMDFIPNPADGMARAVGVALHKEFGQGKLIFDCVMISVTAAVSLIFAHKIIGIGIGTVLSALFIGKLIQFYGRKLGGYMNGVVEKSRNNDNSKYRG